MSQSGRKRLDLSALLQHEKSNYIALDWPTTKPHTVVCRLYGARCRISSSFHATAAALWARDRGAKGSNRALCGGRVADHHRRVCRGRDREGRWCPRSPPATAG